MCQAAHGKWLKCPDQAKGPSNSVREILDNLNTEDSEQKFCCGDIENRFCCGFTEKVREIPGFDPGTHEDSSVRYRFRHHHGYGHFGFLSTRFVEIVLIHVCHFGDLQKRVNRFCPN